MNQLKKYITNKQNVKTYWIFSRTNVVWIPAEQESPSNAFDMVKAIRKIEESLPEYLFTLIEQIDVRYHEDLQARDIEAAYDSGTIYIQNSIPSEDKFFEYVVHEIAHALEQVYGYEIYADSSIENEFKRKRSLLVEKMVAYKAEIPEQVVHLLNHEIDYCKELDNYINNVIGYENLTEYIIGLFITPYSIISLSEYFADGFENFFVGEKALVKAISPAIYEACNNIENVLGEQ